ncbi:cytochrome c biogenesis protein CCS1, chloroplastic-like isoform X2 [Durio zibethinus]|uniref:Cytochrome c biogenesis protein CCS1, chloroplastic-like isoform X2 n=1 Tax=Durio zibethinus TaxID=66656 RepID=A0A6P5Z9H0_DURZI|nr:cytochrome c biogenesis protein CCS1, chloroplastic-like isoform X2 [Durio zibethinus]
METLLNPSKTPKLFVPKTHLFKSSLLHSTFNPQPHTLFSRRLLSITITCKVKTSQGRKNDGKNVSKKILLPDSAPELSNEEVKAKPKSGGGAWGLFRKLPKIVLAVLSNLPLAIGEMFSVAALMALGTAIDQGEAPEFYFQKYPEENPVLGFFTWRWSFLQSADAIRKQEFSDTLPRASVKDLGVVLMGAGYEVFLKGPSLYAFKGLAGRFAPIGVHLAMLLIMAGGTLSATGSFRGSVTVPQGLNFVMGDVLGPTGFLSTPTEAFNTEVHVNRFYMDYYDSGEVSQFHTDLSLFDLNGKEVMRKTLSVNDPLRYGGITIYQTDWSFSALQVLKDDEGPFNLAMAPMKVNGDKKLFGTFLPVGDTDSPNIKGISMLARDLQSIFLYDQQGKFTGVRRPNSKLPIEIDGTKLVIVDAIGSSGLDLKTDPGVATVYAGFGALMLTTCISYLSHAQIWALQDGTTVIVGGKTNRAKAEFPDEMNCLLDRVPEIVESSISKQPGSIGG